jgi:hypothetical protein|tara:strand:- start:418 stop:621 length:204 start_codon:yes stop_codon:yes gene_type:complete
MKKDMPDLRIKPNLENGDLKQSDLFSDNQIDSDEVLMIDWDEMNDNPQQLINILTRRNAYHNRKDNE